MSIHTIESATVHASVDTFGAELISLRRGDAEFVWQAAAAIWPRHAPLLFPIVGRLRNDELAVGNQRYPMTQHGFARDMRFDCLHASASQVCLQLTDSPQTRGHYPYAFSFTVIYTLRDNALDVDFIVGNPTQGTLPFSLGWHPAFNWPAPGHSAQKESYALRFDRTEQGEVGQLSNGLLLPTRRQLTLTRQTLPLHKALFDQDALLFLSVASRKIWLEQNGIAVLSVEFDDFGSLGIWSKPGADFVCIEPWAGHASPRDFDGDISNKPGIQKLPPYSQRSWHCRVRIEN